MGMHVGGTRTPFQPMAMAAHKTLLLCRVCTVVRWKRHAIAYATTHLAAVMHVPHCSVGRVARERQAGRTLLEMG